MTSNQKLKIIGKNYYYHFLRYINNFSTFAPKITKLSYSLNKITMKKRLLFAALAMFCTVGSFAINVGDYVYSHTAKYKVTGNNVVMNGDFNVGDGSEGWRDGEGNGMSQSWRIVSTDVGLGEGINAVECQEASTSVAGTLTNSWQLASGLYVISYKVFTSEDVTCSVTDGNTNYVSFIAKSADDQNPYERVISGAESWKGGEWTQVVDTIFVNADSELLDFRANNITSGVRFSQFEIAKAVEVYDSRVIDRLIEYAEKLLQEPDLANGREDFEIIVGMLKEAIQNPENIEDKDAAEALVASFNEAFDAFLNENGGNTVETTGDWTNISSTGFKNLTSYGAWKFDGGRWGFSANDGNLGLPENDGYVAGAGIQTQWEQFWNAYIESPGLPKGEKYFFSIEAKVIPGSSTQIGDNPPYGEDYNYPTVGGENFKMFIGTDTLQMEGETLSGYYWKRYYMIADIPADADAVRAGWAYHFPVGFAKAARAYLRNPEFRLIGKTVEQINYEAALGNIIVQQNELGNRLQNYPNDVANCKWELDSLQRAIDFAQPIYDGSFQVVDAGGNCSLPINNESIEQMRELYQNLLDAVNSLGRAKNYVLNQNAIFDRVLNTIDNAKAVLADELYQDGDKAAFQTAISSTQELFNSIYVATTDGTREADEAALETAIEELNIAIEVFIASANLEPIVDIDFTNPAEEVGNGLYQIVGAEGEMNFATDAFDPDNGSGAVKYMQGWKAEEADPVLEDVLRVGTAEATVEIPEVEDDEVLRTCFNIWFGKLTKKSLTIELRNVNDERVAGFNYNCYENTSDFNDFNNEAGTGMDATKYASGVGDSSHSNDAIYIDNNKSSFELIVDYKNQELKGILSNPQKGICRGEAIPFPEISDPKVTSLVIYTNYNNADRRCWFDDLKVYKYRHTEGSEPIKGDVNADGTVDVADISAIISVMAGTAQYPAADVNGDGTIDVADISNVISIMAGTDK